MICTAQHELSPGLQSVTSKGVMFYDFVDLVKKNLYLLF